MDLRVRPWTDLLDSIRSGTNVGPSEKVAFGGRTENVVFSKKRRFWGIEAFPTVGPQYSLLKTRVFVKNVNFSKKRVFGKNGVFGGYPG